METIDLDYQKTEENQNIVYITKSDYSLLASEISEILKPYIYFKDKDIPIIKTLFNELHLKMVQKCKEYADNIIRIDVTIKETIKWNFIVKNGKQAKFKRII